MSLYGSKKTILNLSLHRRSSDLAIKENMDCLILVHDDVILENYSEEKLELLLQNFDVVGVAGTTEVKLQSPALWHIMGGGFDLEAFEPK